MLRAVARNFLSSPGSGGEYAVYILDQSAVAVSGAADTAENTLATITLPANAMGPNGSVRIWTTWTITNGADDKILRVRFGATQHMAYVATTVALVSNVTQISNVNDTASQKSAFPTAAPLGLGTSGGVISTSTIDTTAAVNITITCQKETGTDTITLERYLVEVLYGA